MGRNMHLMLMHLQRNGINVVDLFEGLCWFMCPWIEEGALVFALGCCHPCSGKAVLKGPGATHHFTLFFCHPNELPGREEGD